MTSFPATTPDLWRHSNEYMEDRLDTSGSALETRNTCYTVEGGNMEGDATKEVHTWYLLLVVIPVFTVFGNVLICLSVWREATLQTCTNYFIVSLAIADIMVAILVMPLAIYVQVNDNIWQLGDALCDTWVAFDVMCCTASILNLTAISIDRFIAVTQPLRYARHKNSKRVYITLASTWVVSVAVSLPIAVGWNYTERRSETPWLCTFYNADFLIYSSMASFYIPCLLMSLLYYKTFRAILRQAERKRLLKKEKKMVEQKGEVAQAARRSCGVEVKGQGEGRRPSRVSAPTQSTTDSEMSENSGSVCSVFEDRVSRSTLLRVFSAREETCKNSIGDQEGIPDVAGCRGECQDDGGTKRDALKDSRELCTNDDGVKDEMDEVTWHSIGRQSEKLWISGKRDTSGSVDRFEAKRNIGLSNRGGSDTGSCVLEEPKKNVSCDKEKVVGSSNTEKSTKQVSLQTEGNADSYEGKESNSYIEGDRGYRGYFQPTGVNASGIGELSKTMYHEREDGKEMEKASMELYYSGAPKNSSSCYRNAVRMGDGKERLSWNFEDSTKLVHRGETRKRLFSDWNYPQERLSSAGNDPRNTTSLTREFLRDMMSFNAHGLTSPYPSKVSKETSSFGNEVNQETSELQSHSRGDPTLSIRPICVRKRSRGTWPGTTEGLRESFTAEVPKLLASAKKEFHGNTSFIPSVAISSTKGCQMETQPSTGSVRKETSLSTTGGSRIALIVSEEEEEEEEEQKEFDALSLPRIREENGKARDGLIVDRQGSEGSRYFTRVGPRRSFDLSDNTGLLCTSQPSVSTRSLTWQNFRDSNCSNASAGEMLEWSCSGEMRPTVYKEFNRQAKEVREVQNICPDSSTREVPRTCGDPGTKDEQTARNESSTIEFLQGPCAVQGSLSGMPDGQSTSSTRHFQPARDGSTSPGEPRTSFDSCESRPLTRDSLTGERIRPRDYSSHHHHHHHHRAPAQHSISVPARLEPPRAVCCRRDQAITSARFDAGRNTRPLLTARQRDALLEARVEGHQGIKTQVASGREKRERVFTKRERKATTTLAIVLGVFLLCWVPFFTLNIVNAVCIRYDLFGSSVCSIHKVAFDFFVWLGYFNSFFNPVIYTIFNAEFRKAFKRLFAEPCR